MEGLIIKDLALKTFAKKIWRMNGFLIKNIEDYRINVDFKESKITFYIKGINGEVLDFDITI